MKKILIEILGKHAYNNGMKVDPEMEKLLKAVDYLIAQLLITRRWCNEEGNEHVSKVLNVTELILSGD